MESKSGHPNMVPVLIQTHEIMKRVADEMRKAAEKLAVDEDPKPHYSRSEDEAIDKVRRDDAYRNFIIESGTARCVVVRENGKWVPLSLSFTKDVYTQPHRWHLSVGIVHPSGTIQPSDAIAQVVCRGFFGEEYEELPQEGPMQVRHFGKKVGD